MLDGMVMRLSSPFGPAAIWWVLPVATSRGSIWERQPNLVSDPENQEADLVRCACYAALQVLDPRLTELRSVIHRQTASQIHRRQVCSKQDPNSFSAVETVID